MKKLLLAFSLLTALSCFAQSSPGLVYGQIPTAGQWNSYFAGKFDYNVNGLAVSFGGTGSTTATGALRNLIGAAPTTGYFVRGNGASWVAGQIQASDLPAIGGITGGTTGALLYQSAPSVTSFLSGNTTTAPQFLTSTGTGSAAQAPTLTSATGSGNVVLATSPTLVTPTLGAATATSINGNTITTGAGTLTLNGKTLATSNSLTLAGTDATTMTFPSTSASIARTDNSNTFSGTQTFSGTVAGTALSTYLASPPAIGGTVAAAGAFTTLSASGAVSGTGFVNMQASPNPIGSVTPSTGAFTTLSATGHTTFEGVTSTGSTGTGKLVYDTAPTFTTSVTSPLFRSTAAKVLIQGTGTGATQLAATQTTPPTCTSQCGSSPSVAGTDTAGIVTMGSGGLVASGWVLTFNGTWASAPSCTVTSYKSGMVAGKAPIVVTTTTTTFTVTTNGTAPSNSDQYSYICMGTQ